MQTGFNKLEECCWMSALWASQQDTAFVPPWHQEWYTSLTCSLLWTAEEKFCNCSRKGKENQPPFSGLMFCKAVHYVVLLVWIFLLLHVILDSIAFFKNNFFWNIPEQEKTVLTLFRNLKVLFNSLNSYVLYEWNIISSVYHWHIFPILPGFNTSNIRINCWQPESSTARRFASLTACLY